MLIDDQVKQGRLRQWWQDMRTKNLWLACIVILSAGHANAQNTFPATGNVGIGTTTPGDQLTVVGTTSYSQGQIMLGDGGNFSPYIHTYRWTGNGSNYFQTTIGNSLSVGGALEFQTGNGGAIIGSDPQATRMVILPRSGNVGIGTSSPTYSLDVGGAIHSSNGFVFPDGTTQTTAYANNGVITASDPTYGSINLKISGANTPVITFTRWSGSGSIQNNAYAGLFFNASDGYFDYGIGTGVSATGDQTATNTVVTVTQNGTVGIGTTSPSALLEVKGNVKLTNGSGASLTFADGTVQSTAWNGTLCGGDYAESVDVSGERSHYEPGDVMVIDPNAPGKFLKSGEPYSTAVAGIYSTKPGMVGRRQTAIDPQTSTTEVPMAMVGIVPTKVSAENGPIKPGDTLVTSSTLGHAMKGTDRSLFASAVVGKALGRLDSGTGVIEVLVSLQ
jgi:hypothetical protein